jgi:hypothetical protein
MNEGANEEPAPRRRGRPPGSVTLTPEIADTILALIESGAWDYVAAEVAGVDGRTFRDWIARGERRHPTRRPTPELEAFARQVREAKARARAVREVEVANRDPKYWLTRLARSKPGREGWTEPVGEEPAASGPGTPYEPTPQEAIETIRILVAVGAISLECPDPPCPCPLHRRPAND